MRTVPILAALSMLLLAACGNDPAPDPVKARIEAATSCERLQGEFDWASARHKTQDMEAADARMKALACY
jgi:hypothetical protein